MANQFRQLPRTVYHGTTSNALLSLHAGIDLDKGNGKADFGQGFYTTTNLDQAMRRAVDKSDEINLEEKEEATNNTSYTPKYVSPIVIEYQLDVKALEQLESGLILPEPNETWAEFIYNNRRKRPDFSSHHNLDNRYPFVFGILGDKAIMNYIRQFERGEISSLAELLHKIYPKKMRFPKDQIHLFEDQLSLHTPEAASCLEPKGVRRHVEGQNYRSRVNVL